MVVRKLYSKILERFHRGKVILVLGPRQVGKTTLIEELVSKREEAHLWLNGDEADVREILSNVTSTRLRSIIGDKKLVVIDEAQRIHNIGITLKLLVDTIKDMQVIVTGSSALELADEIKEPLTGRKYEYNLFPLSFAELVEHSGLLEERRQLEHRLIYGAYPEIVTTPSEEKELLKLLSNSYLYKDLLAFNEVKNPSLLEKILLALALQVSGEVKFNELAKTVGSTMVTVERYIDLLEKAYVIFRLPSLARNVRNEIKKGKKIYFYDNGVRNAIVNNFNPLNMRSDIGQLWENYCVSERVKMNAYNGNWCTKYFWRTQQQQEVDYIEERDGNLFAFEFKWNSQKKVRFPLTFQKSYPESEMMVVTPENYDMFLLD